ncbi:MAG: tRNA (N6-threonylcarbamoyladenosine(37)-N6)-methyltransferase TrmO [Nitrososphaeria archaeon]
MFTIKPIGIVHIDVADNDIRNRGSAQGKVEIYEEYAEGLHSLEGFSHIILVTYLHHIKEPERRILKVKFRHLQSLGIPLETLPEVGVFCSDSPHRPNPIGVSIIHVLKIDGRIIYADNLDLFDGTPVIDIKPYTPFRRIESLNVPEWYAKIIALVKKEP